MTQMTSTATGHPPVIVIDIEDTVTIHYPDSETTRDLRAYRSEPPFRRPAATGEQRIVIPRTIGIVDGGEGGSAPARPFTPAAPGYLARLAYSGTRRKPGLFARLLGLDGLR